MSGEFFFRHFLKFRICNFGIPNSKFCRQTPPPSPLPKSNLQFRMIHRQKYGLVFLLLFLGIGIAIGILLAPSRPVQQILQSQPAPLQVISKSNSNSSEDSRYTRAPKPERDWLTTPDMSAVVNSPTVIASIPTRGLPDSYQSFGIITVGGNTVFPLYGRHLASRSGRFQYYTRTDTYNPVQLPIRYNNRDCQDDIGCEELFDGDIVQIPGNGTAGRVSIYRFSGPAYVPVIL